MTKVLVKIIKFLVFTASFMTLLFCSIINLIYTSKVIIVSGNDELIVTEYGFVFFQVFLFVVIIIILLLLKKVNFIERINIKILRRIILIIITILGIIWVSNVFTYPSTDSGYILYGADSFHKGDFNCLKKGYYFDKYPFQVGYTTYLILLSTLIGYNQYKLLMVINVIYLIVAYNFLLKIGKLLFNNEINQLYSLIFLLLFFPGILYCSFIYGVIPGLMFCMIGSYYLLLYLKDNKLSLLVLSGLFMSIAYIIKPNYLLFIVAAIIVIFCRLFQQIKKCIISLIVFVLIAILPNRGLLMFYSFLAQHELKGIPKSAWLVMGMQESSRAPGWYNGYNEKVYIENDYDYESTNKIVRNDLITYSKYFFENPEKFLEHYLFKTISQWTEPTFESIWLSEVRYNYKQQSREVNCIGKFIYEGVSNYLLIKFVDFYNSILYITATIAILVIFKNKKKNNELEMFLPLAFLGGFSYHLLFEAKSQYLIVYAIILIPYSAEGLRKLIHYLEQSINARYCISKANKLLMKESDNE